MVAQTNLKIRLSTDTMLPDLLACHPQARAVFDRYGLRGCGGHLGPVESLGFFARTHGVDEHRLLGEIRDAVNGPAAASEPLAAPSVADAIYRRFFTAGIVLILTAGATWGAWLLWQIGVAGKFTGISLHQVNAHGHAQIFGWVGLFIMGFAYQAFPRLWHTDLVWPRLAVAAFISMVLGLIIRTTGMTMAGASPHAIHLAMIGGGLEIASIFIFVTQILTTFRRSNAKLEPYIAFAIASLVSFVAMAFMSVWHTWTTMTAATRDDLLWHVATYQAPLRDLQIHGLAMLMILGVSIRMLPALFGVPEVPRRRAWTALAILIASVIGEIAIFIAYRFSGIHWIAALLMIPWIMLTVGAGMIALPWKLWRPLPTSDRSGKFVRAAYAWLAISLVMLLMLPVHQALSGIPFSHAYYGAIRHAITVGFISLMIMGFAAKVVPTLNGIDTRILTSLWGPFILVNLGCFLRCSMQTLTDFYPGFFAAIGISGTLEVAGLAWWGFGLIRIMKRGKRQAAAIVEQQSPSEAPSQIEAGHNVLDVLTWFPRTEDVFYKHGFTMLKNPVLRLTLARSVSITQATTLKAVDRQQFLRELNEAAFPQSAEPQTYERLEDWIPAETAKNE